MATATTVATDFPHRELSEEIANGVTHGIGTVLSVCALVVLATYATLFGSVLHVITCSVFGSTLILAYAASTLYHSIQRPQLKGLFRLLDHSAIFLLIAGTYTPFTLVSLRGPWGWTIFGLVWGLAVVGIVVQVTVLHRWTAASLTLYVAMGWIAVIAVKPILMAVPAGALVLLLLGGLSYTGGVAFFVNHRLPYNHAIWHLFVLAGSIFHFFAILLYVVPTTAVG
jgi:hemolysin III